MLPLGTDVEDGTVVVGIHDGDTQTQTQLEVFRTVLPIYIIIRCSIARSHPVTDVMENTTRASGIGDPLRTYIQLITVFEQTTAQSVSVVFEGRIVDATPLLELEVSPHPQLLVVVVGHTHAKGCGDAVTIGDGIGGRIGLGNGSV